MAYNENPSYLKLAGGTMSGALILNADPATALGASTKQYVDNAITAVNPATSVYAASTADIPGTYTHVAGIGDTFLTTATGAFSVDGVSPPLLSRFLFKNQSVGPNTAAFNGVYTLTTNGTGITGTLFTRALDYDQPSDINNTGVINVVNGTVNALTGWLITSTVTTVGTDAINYVKYNNAPGTVTQYAIIVGGANGALASVGPSATAGQALLSGGNAANAAYSTATYPSTAGTSGNVLTSDGTNFNSSTPPGVISSTFTGGQSGTWTINSNTKWVKVYMWGGGGGGGSGRKGATTAAGGGGGGGAGQFVYIDGPSSAFQGGLAYSVGASANGGGAQSSDANNGNPGTVGNNTTLGTLIAVGGNFGSGGVTGTAGGGGGLSTGSLELGYNLTSATVSGGSNGVAGNSGNTTNAGYSSGSVSYGMSLPTGGAGGSGGNTSTAQQAGSAGGLQNLNNTSIVTGAAGGIETGTIGGANGAPQYVQGGIISGGFGGGGGGGAKSGSTGGKGGDGSAPGGGGGGGGGGISTQANSGAGGNGGAGLLIIIEFA